MSDLVSWLKIAHVLSATVLFGTGLGTAFQMWMAHLRADPRGIATVSRSVVLADFAFTAPAVIIQPATGFGLLWVLGVDPLASWLLAAYILYAVAGVCWLPVVWLQIKVRDLASAAVAMGSPLPAEYRFYMRIWFALGWPAFLALIAIFGLMIAKPQLW